MGKEYKKIELKPDTDLAKVVDDVCKDGVPRLLERDGVPVAMVSRPEEAAKGVTNPIGHFDREKFLSFAGAWKDLDTDKMVEDIYRWRHEAPVNPPVEFDDDVSS
ncbi:MAG: hypothetical protein HYU30_01825 [Chloroflexi bacterium]|nr:hypothetical protein [Chloroflexota bacterium]